jgi:uncharacterized membrane-anchored protein
MNENNYKIIGIIHLLFAFTFSFYGILIKKNWFDNIFILYTIIIITSWTFYNGECPISYYIKKNRDKNYIAGKESVDLEDMKLIIGSKSVIILITSIIVLLNSTSLYLVMKRNKFPKITYILSPLCYVIYCFLLRYYYNNLHINKTFLFVQEIVKIIMLFILFFVISTFLY